MIRYEETEYGFDYGSAAVTRLFSDEKKKWVTIGVTTQKCSLQVYCTKTGKVRVFSKDGEWKVADATVKEGE